MTTFSLFGNLKKACINGWVLLGLFLLGVNGFSLMAFSSPTVPGRSPEVKEVLQKRHRLEDRPLVASVTDVIGDFSEEAPSRPAPDSQTIVRAPERPEPGPEVLPADRLAELPRLTGIIETADVHGHLTALAVIDGKKLALRDEFQGFTVEKISPDGVVLSRGGARWTLPGPEIRYSLDRSR